MKRRGGLVAMVLVCLVVVSGCSGAPASTWTIPDPFGPAPTAPAGPTTTSPPTTLAPGPTGPVAVGTTVPAGPVAVVCGGGTEADRPAAPSLNPLLLTVTDITPHGYISSGPDGATSSLLFGGELPLSVPVAAISYGEDTRTGSGLFMDEIDESLADDASAATASALAGQLERASAACSPDDVTVPLGGTVPGLDAVTLLRSEVPTTIVSNQVVNVSSAEVYAAKGPYVVDVSWKNVLEGGSGSGLLPPLPTASVMGAVVDAALAHLPG